MKRTLFIIALIAVIIACTCSFAACGSDNEKVIRVGASSTPHAEILEFAKPLLAERGYTLEIIVYNDYVLPNKALSDGEIDANYFQHTPFLESYNASNGQDLVAAAKIHYEPFGIYGNGISDLKDLKRGATVIIPADDTNCTRALFLLAQENIIELKPGTNALTGITVLDILNNNGYNVITVEAEAVPGQLKNADAGTIAVINGNYALAAGLNAKNALATESAEGETALTYANVVAVRSADAESPKIAALIEVLTGSEVKNYIDSTYNGAVKTLN